jgi:type IV secretion system protein VirD4
VATRTTTTRKGAGRRGASTSVAEHRDPLLTANQVQELPADQMLVFIRGRRPLKLKRIITHTHKAYRAKLDPNPTVRS